MAGKIMFRLKDKYPAFQVIQEGAFAYHTFRPGELYDRVPSDEEYKFEKIAGGEEE